MQYYFAPLEGITDNAYRRLHHKYFPGADRYYMPFFSPTIHRSLTPREARELPYADTADFLAVPQVMTKVAEDFVWAAEVCAQRGYREVNLNAGCPSGTVVAKSKGAGLLGKPDELDRLLDGIFSKAPIPVSVKTRLGMTEEEEFPRLLEIFNRYPICQLTVHPRVRKEFYNGQVRMDMFRYAMENSKNPICYNGDILGLSQAESLKAEFPRLEAVMIGRGLVADPGMLTPGGTKRETLEAFHAELLETYTSLFGGPRNAMFRMKEQWSYWLGRFEGSEKLGKRLRKTTDLGEYKAITNEIFRSLTLKP